jgi:predicted Zn-dependent peptidase
MMTKARIDTLDNGVRVLTQPDSTLRTATVSVFVRSGSVHEEARDGGISHFVEHMAFKGTRTRSARRINLDAERLGADVNAHTDKDHTAFYMHGLGAHATAFVTMLGDIVLGSTFPATELERERQVILAEFTDDEDDPLSAAYRMVDLASFGTHPAARAVIGSRRTIEAVDRARLMAYVRRRYTGPNVVIGASGAIDPAAVRRAAREAFSALPAGSANRVLPPEWVGGLRTRRMAGTRQAHALLAFPLPGRESDDPVLPVAAAALGEGMSAPLLHELRERRGLVYHAHAAADLMDGWGQFVVELTTAPEHLEEAVLTVLRLLRRHARALRAQDLERARNQVLLRRLRAHERPGRRLEDAALALLTCERLPDDARWARRVARVRSAQVAHRVARMLEATPAFALTGCLPPGTRGRARDWLGTLR